MPTFSKLDALSRLAIRAGSDKFGGHLYTPIYHRLFSHLREQPIRLLEIGVGGYNSERAGGLSLKMWAEYFPYATIVGLDSEPKRLDLSPRVHVIQGSQADEELLIQLTREHGPFDIVIDDGSHVVEHMIGSFRTLYPRLAPTGIYAVEDTQTSFVPALGGTANGTSTIFEIANKVSLAMHALEGYISSETDEFVSQIAATTETVSIYRNIAVFHRGSNTYPSNTHLDLDNWEVTEIFDTISEHNALDPSGGGALSRIDMLIWSGRTDEAGKLAMQAAEQYPSDLPLLFELIRMMRWAQRSYELGEISLQLARVL